MGGDGAIVQLYQRAGEVETDTRARLLTALLAVRLIEAFENLLQLVLRNLLTVVADGDGGILLVVSDADGNFATRRREFESVRQHVQDDLVEVAAVYPDGQRLGIVFVEEAYLATPCLMLKE